MATLKHSSIRRGFTTGSSFHHPQNNIGQIKARLFLPHSQRSQDHLTLGSAGLCMLKYMCVCVSATVMSAMSTLQTHIAAAVSQRQSRLSTLIGMEPHNTTVIGIQHMTELLTLKTGVPERFPTETFVILHSIDDDWSTKYVCKNENVCLFQAGSWL